MEQGKIEVYATNLEEPDFASQRMMYLKADGKAVALVTCPAHSEAAGSRVYGTLPESQIPEVEKLLAEKGIEAVLVSLEQVEPILRIAPGTFLAEEANTRADEVFEVATR